MANGRRGPGVFRKAPLTCAQLIKVMVERGLIVADPDLAARQLFHIGYYRLQPYARSFEEVGVRHRFLPGTTFEDLLARYSFDRDLRLLFLDGLARVEVAFRAALSEVMSQLVGEAHWYTRASLFASSADFKVFLGNVQQAVEAGHPVLEEYLARYRSPELPPSWLMVEVLSIGQLNRAYQNLKSASHRSAVAGSLGLTGPVLASWLEVFVRVRNICAHHERLWDRCLPVYPVVPPEPISWPRPWDPARAKSRYSVAAALNCMVSTVAAQDRWAQRLQALLSGKETERRGMGFPEDWWQHPFWESGCD